MTKTNPLLFIRQVRHEISKVVWPSRKETLVTSMMVLIISVMMGLFFLATDGLISSIIGYILR